MSSFTNCLRSITGALSVRMEAFGSPVQANLGWSALREHDCQLDQTVTNYRGAS